MSNPDGMRLLQEELQASERLMWSGKPNPAILLTKADIFLIPFSFLWFGFFLSVAGDIFTSIDKMPFPFFLFPFFFLIVGSYISIGRFVYKYFRKKKTYYFLTDKRVIIITDFLGKNIQAAFLKEIPTINKSVNGKGMGSLVFGNQNMQAAMYGNTGMELFGAFNTNPIPAFYDIPNVQEVYKKVSDLKDK